MARIRSIYPEACESQRLATLSDGAERTFWRLQVHCDDEGRTKAEPELLRSRMYVYGPHGAAAVTKHLNELEDKRYIIRYEVDGKAYLQFLDWKQNPQHPTKSKLPEPPENVIYNIAHEDSSTCIPRVGVDIGVDIGVGDGEEDEVGVFNGKNLSLESFNVTPALKEWATKAGITVDLESQTAIFLDHHAAKGSKFANWDRAWQKWIRQAQEWKKDKVTPQQPNGARIPAPLETCGKCVDGWILDADGDVERRCECTSNKRGR